MRIKFLSVILFLFALIFVFSGCEQGTEGHVHSFSSQWSADNTYHWHQCISCPETEGNEEHSWDNGVTIKEATEDENGKILYTCLICRYTKTEDVNKKDHEHSFVVTNTDEKYLKSSANCLDKAVYYYSCSCGERGEETFEFGEALGHNFENYKSDNNATCGVDGTKTAKCSRCDKTDTITDVGSKLPHTFSEQWDKDEDYHWHAAICEHTDEIKDKSLHVWDNGVETVEATETIQGEMLYTCNVCGQTKTVKTGYAEHVHNYIIQNTSNQYLKSPANCLDKAVYYYSCSCGEHGEATFEYGEALGHNFENYQSDNNATCGADGTKTAKCSRCDAVDTITDIGSKLPHAYSEQWDKDENYHWHSSNCEHSFLKKDEGLHNWVDTGVIITVATETVEGEKEQQCSVCGHIRTVKTGKLDHVHTFIDVWSYDDEYHWHSATCGHDVSSEKAQHAWDSGVVTNQATVYDEGIKTYTCSICGATKEESIPELDSFAVVFMDNNNRTISERNYALGTSGNAIIIPTPISLDGYQFIGWNEITSTINVSLFDFSSAKNNDIYYFKADYEKLFNIVFKDYQGNELLTIIKSESNNNIGIEECPAIPDREGYTSHWDIQTLSNISKDTVITPIYEKITFEVVFKDNVGNVLSYTDGSGNVVKKQIVDYGAFAVAPEYEPYYFNKTEMKMYEFSGWSAPFDSIKENTVIVAQYNKLYEDPVIAVKINGNRVSLSIVLPSKDTTLYSLSLSFKWNVDVGTCSIVDSFIKSSTPLNADTHDGECTVGEKSGWLNYNNKTSTFDFVWNCGHGHSFNNTHFTQDVVTLTFEVDGGASIMESIFTLAENSWIIYGESDGNVSDLQKTKPMIWFYE